MLHTMSAAPHYIEGIIIRDINERYRAAEDVNTGTILITPFIRREHQRGHRRAIGEDHVNDEVAGKELRRVKL